MTNIISRAPVWLLVTVIAVMSATSVVSMTSFFGGTLRDSGQDRSITAAANDTAALRGAVASLALGQERNDTQVRAVMRTQKRIEMKVDAITAFLEQQGYRAPNAPSAVVTKPATGGTTSSPKPKPKSPAATTPQPSPSPTTPAPASPAPSPSPAPVCTVKVLTICL